MKLSEMFPTGQDEYSEKNLMKFQVIHHKSQMDRPRDKTRVPTVRDRGDWGRKT